MDSIPQFCFGPASGGGILAEYSGEVHVEKNTSRFVAVNLTDAEWHALRAVTPDPCAWIKAQIQRLLDESGVAPSREEQESPTDEWGVLTSPSL
jgi:hypothetical protein